jgi:hypothetical protein
MGHDGCRFYSVQPPWATAVGTVAHVTVVAIAVRASLFSKNHNFL